MEKLKLSEQDIVNAICLHSAHKRQVNPNEISVELLWDEDYGFSAEIQDSKQRKQILIQANIIEAIRFWLENELQRDPFAARLELQLDDEEGITAFATYSN